MQEEACVQRNTNDTPFSLKQMLDHQEVAGYHDQVIKTSDKRAIQLSGNLLDCR